MDKINKILGCISTVCSCICNPTKEAVSKPYGTAVWLAAINLFFVIYMDLVPKFVFVILAVFQLVVSSIIYFYYKTGK